MRVKRQLVLTTMALAAIAFSVPAMASAEPFTWTDRHVHLEEAEKTEPKPFEGRLEFTTGFGSFGCDVTVLVVAEGPNKGTVTEFNPTTKTCSGTFAFGGCVLTKDKTNIEEGWHIEVTPSGLMHVTSTSGDLTIHNEYHGCAGGQVTSHLEFESATLTPTLDPEGTINHLHLSATDTSGTVTAHGSVTPEGEKTLGLAT
jgi:hypothetical protein